MKKIILVTGGYLILPVLAFAQFGAVNTFFGNIMQFIDTVLVPFVFAIALLMFIWGMFQYFILGGDSDSEREKGKQLLIWAIVGFVLMVSIWGIVNIIAGGLFGNVSQPPQLPGTPTI